MIIKFGDEPNEIFYVDATSNNGVSMGRWSRLKKHIGGGIKKVALRHL